MKNAYIIYTRTTILRYSGVPGTKFYFCGVYMQLNTIHTGTHEALRKHMTLSFRSHLLDTGHAFKMQVGAENRIITSLSLPLCVCWTATYYVSVAVFATSVNKNNTETLPFWSGSDSTQRSTSQTTFPPPILSDSYRFAWHWRTSCATGEYRLRPLSRPPGAALSTDCSCGLRTFFFPVFSPHFLLFKK